MLDPPVITGIGVVSSIGHGKEAFWKGLIEKNSGIKQISKFDTSPYPYHNAAEINDFSLEDFLSDRSFRRAADSTKYAIGAVSLALKDAGLMNFESKRTSLVVGTTHGAMNMSREFHRNLTRGNEASPMLFVDSVLNASAGNISLCFGIKGGSQTLVGGAPAGIRAIGLAADMLMCGRSDLVIVVGSEELDEVIQNSYSRFGNLCLGRANENEWNPFNVNRKGFVIGEGAGALVLERKKDATKRMARIYAEIGGCYGGFSLNEQNDALAIAMVKSLEKGKLALDSINYLSSGSNGCSQDYIEALAIKTLYKKRRMVPFIGNIRPNIGEMFSATAILQVIYSTLILQKGIVPLNINLSKMHPEWQGLPISGKTIESPIKAVMVNSIGIEGSCASMVIKKTEE